ncbi:hypothetical protein C5167_035278, partial [Papaver somniferum]
MMISTASFKFQKTDDYHIGSSWILVRVYLFSRHPLGGEGNDVARIDKVLLKFECGEKNIQNPDSNKIQECPSDGVEIEATTPAS